MKRPSQEMLQILLDYITDERARLEIEDWERAIGFTVRCRYTERKVNDSFYGHFDNVVDAFAYATRFQNDLNDGMTEEEIKREGFMCDVFPVLPLDEELLPS